MGQFIDLTNKRFGRLLVLGPKTHKGKLIYWLCRCDCGTEKLIRGQNLRNGSSESCGCLQRELISKRTLQNISSQRFGRLLVLNQHKIKGSSGYWLCRCDCGKKKWICTSALKSGATKSCRCLGNENRHKSILQKRKRYKILLSKGQREAFQKQIAETKIKNRKYWIASILLLADQSENRPSFSDSKIANDLGLNPASVYYTRARFADPNFLKMRNEYSRKRLQNPIARASRLASLRRYGQKPETKALQKSYRQNLPADVRARKNARAKIYRQMPEGREARKKVMRQREWRRTPEGKAKKREQVQKYKLRTKQRYNERYRTDSQFRISVSLRKRLNLALKAQNAGKAVRTFELIGCTLAELAAHLEKQFKNGMMWQNYGRWHVDHIIPCAKFDLTDLEQQRKCFHYSNLQPLWATENIVKSNKLVSIPN